MRKLLLLSAIGLLIVGCGEEKITKDFLNGEWICEQKVFKENDLNAEYKEPYKIERQKRIFKFDGEDLYSYSLQTGEKENLIKVDGMNNNDPEVEDSDSGKTTITNEFKKDNENKWTWVYEESFFSKVVELNNKKTKFETICTRIK